jgi:hypothetical protein
MISTVLLNGEKIGRYSTQLNINKYEEFEQEKLIF